MPSPEEFRVEQSPEPNVTGMSWEELFLEGVLIPDNYGFMRLIQRGDLMLAAYEHAEEINWDSKLVQSEDAEV